MDWQLKRRWVDALRSDEWRNRQLFGAWLMRYHSEPCHYCACGLLAHLDGVADDDIWQPAVHRITGEFLEKTVSYMNDDLRLSFPQIADWVEKNVPPEVPAGEVSEAAEPCLTST